jgi:uncharacterized protein YjdB
MAIAAAAVGACDSNNQVAAIAPVVPNSVTPALIIAPNQVTIAVGAQAQLSTNAGASQQGQLQWSSSNTIVATVSPTGLVTGFSAGAATITARFVFDTLQAATATVIVQNPGP